ncbi:unnamed protein product, partial [Ranitomeya imitator]
MFTEGEEMYLQGSTVWHPDCKQTTKSEEKQRIFLQLKKQDDHELESSDTISFGLNNKLSAIVQGVRVYSPQNLTRSSSESVYSRPGSSITGSPAHTICAKVDDEILDYKDLAAIPKVKAIYDIERGTSSPTRPSIHPHMTRGRAWPSLPGLCLRRLPLRAIRTDGNGLFRDLLAKDPSTPPSTAAITTPPPSPDPRSTSTDPVRSAL